MNNNTQLNQSKSPPPPTPLFILHSTKQITFVLFSRIYSNRLYVGNREGELFVYELVSRRPIFKSNLNNQSIINIIETENNKLLVYCRNGSLFQVKIDVWQAECKFLTKKK